MLKRIFPVWFCRFCGKYIKRGRYRYLPDPFSPEKKYGCLCIECKELIKFLAEDLEFYSWKDYRKHKRRESL